MRKKVDSGNKKIIHVVGLQSVYGGNILASLNKLSIQLSNRNIDTSFIFPEGAKDKEWCKELSSKYKVYYLIPKQFSLKNIYMLKKIFHNEKPDIIHTHHDYFDIAVTLAANKKSKVIWHFHNSTICLPKDILRVIKRKLHYGLLGKRAWLISVSEHYRKIIINEGFSKKRTITILNGIDLNRLDTNNPRNNIHNKVKSFNEASLLSFGYPPYIKGTDVLLEACEKLFKQGILFRLNLVFSEAEGMVILEKRYPEGLPEWLNLLPPKNEIIEYYREASIFISASRYETFSYSVAESAYVGLQVISSDIPGLEWAKNIPSVKFFKSENSNELSNVILESLQMEDEIIEMQAKNTKTIIENEFSTDVWVENIILFYSKLLNKRL